MSGLTCFTVTAVAAFAAVPEKALVSLTMTERVGAARTGEYVTFGVPLPKGRAKSADQLMLLQDGKPIAAEILPVTRWWQDGSLRWVHLIFAADCPAKGTKTVTLARRQGAQPAVPGLRCEDRPQAIAIDTGPLTLSVRRKGFNLIDVARVRGESVIETHGRGLGVKVGRREYLACLDSGAAVALEETGPLHAVVHASGALKDKQGERRFDFDCRLHAHAGSRTVRIVLTLLNRQGKIDEPIPLNEWFVELPTTVKSGRCLFGAERGIKAGRLDGDRDAFVYQASSDRHVFGGAVAGDGKGKSTRTDRVGWGALAEGNAGVAAGVKWFWQMFPASVELTSGGLVRVGLYPRRHGKPLDWYPGVARTREIVLSFGADKEAELEGLFAGLQRPLRPFASPKWYCRDTRCFGDLCETGGRELYGEFAEAVRQFDEAFAQANRRCQAFRDLRVIKGVRTESYGLLGYGDGVHYVWTPNVDTPRNVSWDGNYYGYPHMMCVQFLRTGNGEYFDNFEAHALHVADVHTVHYAGERKHLVGGCRYCPPTDHVRIDPKNWSDYRTAQVYVSDLFNHHKVAGVIDRWYFLRDRRCKDVADRVLDYCHRWRYGDNDYGQPRGPGMIMVFCADAYELYGDRDKWVRRASNVLRVHRNRPLRLSFQAGIFLEGLRRYHEMSGDAEALAYLRSTCDRIIEAGGRSGGNCSAAMSFLYRKTGERKYLDMALKELPRSGRFGNPWKEFGLSMRNAHLVTGDLHRIHEGRNREKDERRRD